MESILTSVKKLLGVEDADVQFDPDIIMHINSALMAASQLGVGPPEGFIIEDKTPVWETFTGALVSVAAVKIYVYTKVRLIFDPPASAFLIEALERQIKELEWRINVQVDKIVASTVEVEV